ncbi:ParA family protein [Endozoicomonas montiporae]|uniref:ParA family protein n=1 Tax=Endozoicomonas montiporae TaxID=1027273 RepID=UPI000558B892|nr:ParA family protein [Endozoicomonas montiporae]
MRIYAVINQKGGVGKTTIDVNLGYGLAKSGKRVLLIDLDPQGHSTTVLGDQGAELTVKELFESGSKLGIKELAQPARVHGEVVENLDIVPSNIKLAVSAENLAARIHREKVLANALEKVKGDYDICLIDCPPTLGVLAVNGIFAADRFLIPVTYARYALDGVADLFGIISTVRETDEFNYTIIRNGYDSRTKTTNDFIEGQLEPFAANVAKTRIRKTETINQAAINAEPVFTFDAKGNGTADFEALTKEVVGLDA